jgi:hypothetical protein
MVDEHTTRRGVMPDIKNRLEHRWGERVKVNFPVSLESGVASPGANGCVRNLSLSGALMKSDCDLRLNTLIEVGITLPPPSLRTTVIKAIVSRKLKDGVGIEWHEFAPKIVKELLRRASRSP